MMNPDKEFLECNTACRAGFTYLLAIFLFLSSLSARAQSTASISGTVFDPSRAVVAGATVILHDDERGAQQNSATNDDGSYAFPTLPPSHYRLEIHAPGFKPYLRADLELGAADALKIDPQLALNAEITIVEVSADSLQADTSTSQIGETIAGKKITGVPLNGRGFTDLMAIQPGVLPASSQQPNAVVMAGCVTTPPSGDLNPGNLSVSGQRETANGFVVNGSNVEEDFNMGTAIVPDLDSIQEFRVLTSNADAEYGNYSGGQVIVVTKSGTNQLHGSVFEFLRNTNLDSRNYFSTQRAKFDRHQFGGTVGGPLQKDKIFFFADYQGTRLTQGGDTGRIAVPTAAERDGDFLVLDPVTNKEENLLTGKVSGPYFASLLTRLGYPAASGEAYSSVFPNGVIPRKCGQAQPELCCPPFPNPIEEVPIFPPRRTTRLFATTKERSELTPTPVGEPSPLTTPSMTSFRTIPTPRDRAVPTSPALTLHQWGRLSCSASASRKR